MTPVEALKMSLKREEASISLYKKMIVEHPVIKELLYTLLNEEEKHKIMIEKKIAELNA